MNVLARQKQSHVWKADALGHYVEPSWCAERLLQAESFTGAVLDPCAGWGRIPQAVRAAGLVCYAGDIVSRGFPLDYEIDFLSFNAVVDNVITNPPFDKIPEIVDHALIIASRKVAAIVPARRLNAMGPWLAGTPIYRIHFLSPRPSMPPGDYIAAGGKIGGGTADYVWAVWLQGYSGAPTTHWLHRDRGRP